MAADTVSLPGLPPGRYVVAPGDPAAFNRKLHEGYENAGSMAVVDVAGQPFTKALRLTSTIKGERSYVLQVKSPTIGAVESGDALLLTMMARCTQPLSGKDFGKVGFALQLAKPPWDGYSQDVNVGREWTKVVIAFNYKSKNTAVLDPGGANFNFSYAHGPQTIEVADVQLVNFGKSVDLAALPVPPLTYAGREADAAWRKAALARIDQIRKGDLTVSVKDAAGQPVVGADIQVRMTRQAFHWGTAVSGQRIARWDDADSQRYKQEIPRLFNTIVFESDMKWVVWNEPKTQSDVERVTAWAKDRGLSIRGHCLVWPSWRKNKPEFEKQFAKDPAGLAKAIDAHLNDILKATAGDVYEWDVVNETRTSYDWLKLLGENAMVGWFQTAHKLAPNATLVFNENHILDCSNEYPNDDHEVLDRQLKLLIDAGAPVTGLGVQSHFAKGRLSDPEVVLKVLDHYGQLKLPIKITEYDFDVADQKLQGDYTRDFLIACYSHPSVDGFLMWGFWDGQHFAKNAPIFNKDWSLKPSGQAYQDLVGGQWWTKVDGKSAAGGAFRTRGFLGDYEITVSAGGKTKTAKAQLGKDGTKLEVVLE